jgi:hypothetical protein
MCDDFDLAITRLGDLDIVTQVANTAVDLDAIMQELLERRDIKNLVVRWLGGVDDILHSHVVSTLVFMEIDDNNTELNQSGLTS